MLTIGQVLVSGGANFATHKFTELASAELYPLTARFARLGGGPNT